MLDRVDAFASLGGGLVELVLEDQLDAAVAVAADGERRSSGGVLAGVAVALGRVQESQAGAGLGG